MEKDKFERHKTITGRVVLHEDGDGIEILTDEEVYAVELDYVGKQLLDFAERTIRAAGFLSKYSDEYFQIELDDYEVLDGELCIESEFDYSKDYSFKN